MHHATYAVPSPLPRPGCDSRRRCAVGTGTRAAALRGMIAVAALRTRVTRARCPSGGRPCVPLLLTLRTHTARPCGHAAAALYYCHTTAPCLHCALRPRLFAYLRLAACRRHYQRSTRDAWARVTRPLFSPMAITAFRLPTHFSPSYSLQPRGLHHAILHLHGLRRSGRGALFDARRMTWHSRIAHLPAMSRQTSGDARRAIDKFCAHGAAAFAAPSDHAFLHCLRRCTTRRCADVIYHILLRTIFMTPALPRHRYAYRAYAAACHLNGALVRVGCRARTPYSSPFIVYCRAPAERASAFAVRTTASLRCVRYAHARGLYQRLRLCHLQNNGRPRCMFRTCDVRASRGTAAWRHT